MIKSHTNKCFAYEGYYLLDLAVKVVPTLNINIERDKVMYDKFMYTLIF